MVTQEEYRARRQQLAEQVADDSLILIAGASELYRNGDTHYRFRQESDFYYFTGFKEPDAVLIIATGQPCLSILFNRPKDPLQEQWCGARLGQELALTELHMDKAYAIEHLARELAQLLTGKKAVYYSFGKDKALEQQVMQALQGLKGQVRRGITAPDVVCDLEPIIGEMRLFKSEGELALMRRAADISVAAHRRAMKACAKAQYEYELEAELLYEFSRHGCRSVAYDSIVACGGNACTLHYTDNNKPLKKGDLVLIDAGGEYENYAADITRTFPVNGVFNPEQRALYELVLKAQRAGIAAVKPGAPWNSMQTTIIHILTTGLCALGILKGDVDSLIAEEAYKPFYMHNSGHWLGLDVHDTGRYKINNQWRPLEPGMVLTVEPGLYISEDPDVEPRWWNIGIRIEDDVLVTATGHEVLTAALPVDIADIEALMRD